MYGANQAMAMAVDTKKSGKPFDPRSVDLPSMGALIGFYHACVSFPVKQTWLDAIKAGNFNSLPGLTYANASRTDLMQMKLSRDIFLSSAKMCGLPSLSGQLL